jgi:hypothetical protein
MFWALFVVCISNWFFVIPIKVFCFNPCQPTPTVNGKLSGHNILDIFWEIVLSLSLSLFPPLLLGLVEIKSSQLIYEALV